MQAGKNVAIALGRCRGNVRSQARIDPAAQSSLSQGSKMVMVVVVINVLISLACLYVARRIVKLRSQLAKAANAIVGAERSTHSVLNKAPKAISKGELGVNKLRSRYDKLELQLQQVQKILALIGLVQNVWRRRSKAKKPKFRQKLL